MWIDITKHISYNFDDKICRIICKNSKNKEFKILVNFININQIEILDISGQYLTNKKIKYLFNDLYHNKSLVKISLYNNKISENGIKYICKYLLTNRSLQFLNLGFNIIDTISIKYLSEVLIINKTLTELYLYYSHLTYKSIELISNVLLENNTLQILNLGFNNDIKDTGCKKLTESLKNNKSLTHLYLSKIGITNNSLIYLSELLKINSNIQLLELKNNDFDSKINSLEYWKYLYKVLKYNKTLKILDLSNNDIGDFGCKYLSKSLIKNNTLITLNLDHCGVYYYNKYFEDALNKNSTLLNISILNKEYFSYELEDLLKINKNPKKYQKEFDQKLMNKIKYLKIEWKPNRNIHFMYPEYLRKQIEYLYFLFIFDKEKEHGKDFCNCFLYQLPIEIFIKIIQFFI